MSDDAKSSPDWTKDWQAMQQQYWNAWNDLTRNQSASQPAAAMPWHEGLEQWSRMFSGAGKQSEAVERLMASAKNYLGVMQSMLAFAAGKNALEGGTAPWLDALRGGMNVPGMDPAAFANMPGFDPALLNNPVAKAVRDISGQGVRNFQQLAEGAAPMLKQFQAEGMSWLHAPAFGYLREHQEHYQKMALAFADFQGAARQYNELMLKASQRSFEILENKLAERTEPGRQIDSMRALYDLWVDAAEEAYAEIALSDEFRKVYGDVVNAQMRVRSQLQQEVERIGADLGMPTRTELNSVHQRLHDLRRELRNGRGSARSDARRDAEVAALRGQIAELKRLLVNAEPAAKGAAPKPAIAKPTIAKPASAKPAIAPARRASSAKPARAAKRARRPTPKRAAGTRASKRAVRAPAPKSPRATRVMTIAAPPPSFVDAIAAMRKQATPAGAKKPRPARMARPARSAPASSRSKPRAKSGSTP